MGLLWKRQQKILVNKSSVNDSQEGSNQCFFLPVLGSRSGSSHPAAWEAVSAPREMGKSIGGSSGSSILLDHSHSPAGSPIPQPTASSRMTLMTSIILLRFIFAQRDETTMRRNALRSLKGIQGRERRLMHPVFHTPNTTIQLQVGTGSNVITFRNHTQVFLQKGLVCVYAPCLWALTRFTLSYA